MSKTQEIIYNTKKNEYKPNGENVEITNWEVIVRALPDVRGLLNQGEKLERLQIRFDKYSYFVVLAKNDDVEYDVKIIITKKKNEQ